MSAQPRIDPIRDRYFRVLERCEKITDSLFFVSAGLALGAVFTDQSYPVVTSVLQIVFVVIVCAMLVLDVTSRFFLSPRGADARLKDFWAKVYNHPLTTETTVGYFNSNEASAPRRAAAQVAENVWFTRTIVTHMFKKFLPLAAASLVVLLSIWLSRSTSMSLVASITQVVLAEQILVRGVRMFWLKTRCDRLFDDLQQLFLANHNNEVFASLAFEYITKYEASKALASITLSDSIFKKLNPELSVKWDEIKPRLRIT